MSFARVLSSMLLLSLTAAFGQASKCSKAQCSVEVKNSGAFALGAEWMECGVAGSKAAFYSGTSIRIRADNGSQIQLEANGESFSVLNVRCLPESTLLVACDGSPEAPPKCNLTNGLPPSQCKLSVYNHGATPMVLDFADMGLYHSRPVPAASALQLSADNSTVLNFLNPVDSSYSILTAGCQAEEAAEAIVSCIVPPSGPPRCWSPTLGLTALKAPL